MTDYRPPRPGSPLAAPSPYRENNLLDLKKNQWILVVEDSASDIILVRIALREYVASEQLKWVADGEQAILQLTALAAGDPTELPDTMMLDLNLPRVNGYAILAHIKKEPSLNGVAVFVYTSSESESDRKRALAQGADGFLTKPNDLAGYARLPGAIQAARGARSSRIEGLQQ